MKFGRLPMFEDGDWPKTTRHLEQPSDLAIVSTSNIDTNIDTKPIDTANSPP